MKKIMYTVAILTLGYVANAQVGIGTNLPAATLDVTGTPATATVLDGIIAPRMTGAQLRAKTYTAAQTGAIVYATVADTAPAGQTIDVTAAGQYYFNGTKWVSMTPVSFTEADGIIGNEVTNITAKRRTYKSRLRHHSEPLYTGPYQWHCLWTGDDMERDLMAAGYINKHLYRQWFFNRYA